MTNIVNCVLISGVPYVRKGRKGVPGSPGYLEGRVHLLIEERSRYFSVKRDNESSFKFKLDKTSVDLKGGAIECDVFEGEIPERIAFAFCVSMLHTFCQPRPRDWEPNSNINFNGVQTSDSRLLRACGLLEKTPSNHYASRSSKTKKTYKHKTTHNRIYTMYGMMVMQTLSDSEDENDEDEMVDAQDVAANETCAGDIAGISSDINFEQQFFSDDSIFSSTYQDSYDNSNDTGFSVYNYTDGFGFSGSSGDGGGYSGCIGSGGGSCGGGGDDWGGGSSGDGGGYSGGGGGGGGGGSSCGGGGCGGGGDD